MIETPEASLSKGFCLPCLAFWGIFAATAVVVAMSFFFLSSSRWSRSFFLLFRTAVCRRTGLPHRGGRGDNEHRHRFLGLRCSQATG